MGVNRKAAQFKHLQRQLDSLPTYSLASSAQSYDQIKRAAVTSEETWESLAVLGRAEEERDHQRDLNVAAGRAYSTVRHNGAAAGRGKTNSSSEEHMRVLRALDSDANDEGTESKSGGRQRWSHRLLDRMGAIAVGGSGGRKQTQTGRTVVVGVPVRSDSSKSRRKRGGSKKSSDSKAAAAASELDMVLPAKLVMVFSVSYEGVEVPLSWPSGKSPGDFFRVSVDHLFDPARLARVDAQLSGRMDGL